MKLINNDKLQEAIENIDISANNMDKMAKVVTKNVIGEVPFVFSDTIRQHIEAKKRTADNMKEKNKVAKEMGEENQRMSHTKIKNKQFDKLELSESLFEDAGEEETLDNLDDEEEIDEEEDSLFYQVYDELIGEEHKGVKYPFIGLTYTEVFKDIKGDDNDIVINKIVSTPEDKDTLYKARDIIRKYGGKTKLEKGSKKHQYILHGMFEESLKKESYKLKRKNKIDESITVEIDEDTALDMLMDRLEGWTTDRVTTDLYEKMYQSYIDGGVFDGGTFDVAFIVDNDYVNYCDVIDKSDERFEEVLKAYKEEGLGDVSAQHIGCDYIEAVDDEENPTAFLVRL